MHLLLNCIAWLITTDETVRSYNHDDELICLFLQVILSIFDNLRCISLSLPT
jgi:hypothetical protein